MGFDRTPRRSAKPERKKKELQKKKTYTCIAVGKKEKEIEDRLMKLLFYYPSIMMRKSAS